MIGWEFAVINARSCFSSSSAVRTGSMCVLKLICGLSSAIGTCGVAGNVAVAAIIFYFYGGFLLGESG